MMTDRRTGTVVKWSAATLGLLVVSVPVAWLLVHGLSHPTEPRWTEADLPASPPDADNGWTEIGSSVSAVDLPALDRLLDPETALEDRLASYDRAAGSLAIEARQHASEIERLRRAYERPRFADGCPLDPTGPGCAWLAALAAERLVVLDAFRQLHAQDARGALATAAMLVRAHVDLAATARSLVATRVAAVCLARAFALAEVLTTLADRAGLDRSTWAASGRSIRESATRHVEHPLDPARGVIAEYVWARAALRAFVGTPGGPSRWTTDLRATTEWLDQHYLELHDYATGARATPPATTNPTDDFAWWAHNPGGEMIIATLVPALVAALEQLRDDREALLRQATALGDLPAGEAR